MAADEPVIAWPMKAFGIAENPNEAGVILQFEQRNGSFAVTLTPNQLSAVTAEILAAAGTMAPSSHLQTIGSGTLSARPIRVTKVGLSAASDERFVVLGFPVGHLTLAVEVPLKALVNVIRKHLSGEPPAPGPAKPN